MTPKGREGKSSRASKNQGVEGRKKKKQQAEINLTLLLKEG